MGSRLRISTHAAALGGVQTNRRWYHRMSCNCVSVIHGTHFRLTGYSANPACTGANAWLVTRSRRSQVVPPRAWRPEGQVLRGLKFHGKPKRRPRTRYTSVIACSTSELFSYL